MLHAGCSWHALVGLRRRAGRCVRARAAAATCACRRTARFHLSDYAVALVGKIMCYAIVALAMDLIWGYTGILSLGHGAVLRARRLRDGHVPDAPDRRATACTSSDLPDFMVFLDWKAVALALVRLPTASGARCCWSCWCPALLAFVFGYLRVPLAHQGRVLLDHHAGADLRGDAAVLPQRHRLRRQQRLHRLQAHPRLSRSRRRRRAWRCSCVTGVHAARRLAARALHRDVSKFGRVLHGDPRRRERA